MSGIIDRSDQAEKNIFNYIKRVEGILGQPERKPSRFETGFNNKPSPDQVELVLEEATILEMEEGYDAPDLKDDRFVWWLTYAQPGKDKPSNGTFFVQGFCRSAEEVMKAKGKPSAGWRDLVGERVTLERQERLLFKRPRNAQDPEPEEGEDPTAKIPIYQSSLVFVTGDEDSGGVEEYVKALVLGKNKVAAKRSLMLDGRAKKYPEYKAAIEDDSICEILGIAQDENGVYVEAEETQDSSS